MCTTGHLPIDISMWVLCFVSMLSVCLWCAFPLSSLFWKHRIYFFILKTQSFKLASKTSILDFKELNSFWSNLGFCPCKHFYINLNHFWSLQNYMINPLFSWKQNQVSKDYFLFSIFCFELLKSRIFLEVLQKKSS